jgi:PEP-CTERM motif
MKSILLAAALAASSAAFVAPAAHAATTVTFPMNTSGTVAGGGREYTVTVGSTTVKVRVTAWSTSSTAANGSVLDASLGVYSPNGLGVTNDNEPSTSPHHTIDNSVQKDFVIFQFDQPVKLVSGDLTTYDVGSGKYDSDATVAFGNTNINWQSSLGLNNGTYAQLSTLFGNSFNTVASASTNSQTTATKLLNTSGNVGNIWLIGAAFNNPVENCGTSGKDLCLDGFKLAQVSVVAGVPEPSTWMMMILGFGFVGMAARRRKQTGNASPVLNVA